MKYFFIFFLSLFSIHKSSAINFPVAKGKQISLSDLKMDSAQLSFIVNQLEKDSSSTGIKRGKKENTKLIAAILAFPVPFGFLGLHRIYLGTDPWVPVVYTATLGGGMLLPLMDFIAIIAANDEELKQMENNPKMFMWIN
ncbi:MAG TPA: TM2 domain-containing protein [Bacteroidia bacterium]|nr:TM2 domain-containing protein [Bacteroidia bacterium]